MAARKKPIPPPKPVSAEKDMSAVQDDREGKLDESLVEFPSIVDNSFDPPTASSNHVESQGLADDTNTESESMRPAQNNLSNKAPKAPVHDRMPSPPPSNNRSLAKQSSASFVAAGGMASPKTTQRGRPSKKPAEPTAHANSSKRATRASMALDAGTAKEVLDIVNTVKVLDSRLAALEQSESDRSAAPPPQVPVPSSQPLSSDPLFKRLCSAHTDLRSALQNNMDNFREWRITHESDCAASKGDLAVLKGRVAAIADEVHGLRDRLDDDIRTPHFDVSPSSPHTYPRMQQTHLPPHSPLGKRPFNQDDADPMDVQHMPPPTRLRRSVPGDLLPEILFGPIAQGDPMTRACDAIKDAGLSVDVVEAAAHARRKGFIAIRFRGSEPANAFLSKVKQGIGRLLGTTAYWSEPVNTRTNTPFR
ncbi:hypothetical protein JR316_0012537 [Psilocybe cubensis]|uniref:Uncharacterized protein n=1 Tax=Psilocybe cubensis TaxID=181762 RepID=A0ACB8GIS8_PSICU|nr:hypothetical protein JR316_0012537 [Psilocybe cubensis]KAH9475426.1 hypothetical protein JR316_0012537 [Psilocybe cubensis]